MTTIDCSWTEAPQTTFQPTTPSNGRLGDLVAELRAVLEGMFIQVAPDHHDAIDAPLRRDMGLD